MFRTAWVVAQGWMRARVVPSAWVGRGASVNVAGCVAERAGGCGEMCRERSEGVASWSLAGRGDARREVGAVESSLRALLAAATASCGRPSSERDSLRWLSLTAMMFPIRRRSRVLA